MVERTVVVVMVTRNEASCGIVGAMTDCRHGTREHGFSFPKRLCGNCLKRLQVLISIISVINANVQCNLNRLATAQKLTR